MAGIALLHHLTLTKAADASSAQYLLGMPAASNSFSFLCRSACTGHHHSALFLGCQFLAHLDAGLPQGIG